jgi:peptidase E
MYLIGELVILWVMAKLYFLGGENVAKRDAKEVNALAFQDSGGSPSVLVLSWARPSFDLKYQRRKRLTDYFRSLGASSVDFLEFSESEKVLASKIASSDLIYITGGQVSVLLSRLRKWGVGKLLRSYSGVLVGRSAGAMVFGRRCLVTSRYSGVSRMVKGLGFVDFNVKAHYDLRKDGLLKKASRKERIYGLPQRSALVYDGSALSFVGDVFIFENGEKRKVSVS